MKKIFTQSLKDAEKFMGQLQFKLQINYGKTINIINNFAPNRFVINIGI